MSIYTSLTCEVFQHGQLVHEQVHDKLLLTKCPVMVNSSICVLQRLGTIKNLECEYDHGGYFILRGKERVIVPQEKIHYDEIYVIDNKKTLATAELRSVKLEGEYSVLLQVKFNLDFTWSVILPGNNKENSLVDVLQTLDASPNYTEMFAKSDQMFLPRFSKGSDKVPLPIGIRPFVDWFPHLSFVRSVTQMDVLWMILRMVRKCIAVFRKEQTFDYRDHLMHKRIDGPGELIGSLMQALLRRALRSCCQHIEKQNEFTHHHFPTLWQKFTFAPRFYQCFSTGTWGMIKSNYVLQGVTQTMSRLSHLGFASHMRRIMIPIGRESKNTQVRQLHPSSKGFICPVATPEGTTCGIVKNLALFTRLSETIPCAWIVPTLLSDEFNIQPLQSFEQIAVIVNGTILGAIEKQEKIPFLRLFQEFRRKSFFPSSCSCHVRLQEILIQTDAGRLLRPVLTTPNPSTDNWDEAIRIGELVYLDSGEIESCRIQNYKTILETDPILPTFWEVDPTVQFGLETHAISFPDHTQAARNIFQVAMTKQAIGISHTNPHLRFDTNQYQLFYPQSHLLLPTIAKLNHVDDLPCGINSIVAICSYTGFNQEDSILVNQAAIDRGMFMSSCLKTLTLTENKRASVMEKETIQVPPQSIRPIGICFDKLGIDGIVPVGLYVQPNDALVGKVSQNKEGTLKDCSLISKETGIIERVCRTTDSSGLILIKVLLRQVIRPKIGDKFVSSAAQKGTIGMVFSPEDMPFSSDGIVPDIVLNPHAIPSRMTINMLLEMLCGKVGSLNGTIYNSVAFAKDGNELINEMGTKLTESGYEFHGEEMLTNGMTGEPLHAHIFIGPCMYYALKHLVHEKVHARSRGNMQLLNRQPCAGRSKHGGLKFGEMERDSVIAHGTMMFLKERLMDMSDPYEIQVCRECGMMINYPESCDHCSSTQIRYALKLLFHDLMALGIKMRVNQ